MKVSNKILSGLIAAALLVPGTASASTYHSDSDTSLGLLDYLESQHRAAREKAKVTPEEKQLLQDTSEMAKHLRYPVDPTKAAPVSFEGDDLTWNQTTGDFEAKGKVKVTQLDNHRFTGEDVDGNTISERIHIPGKGRMLQLTPGQTKVLLDGYETNYNYKDRTGTMESAKGQVADNYMSGKRFEFYPDKIIVYDGTKTKCSAQHPDYNLYAQKIEIYPNDKMIMHNVKFLLKGNVIATKSLYTVDLTKNQNPTDWLPRVGYDKTNGVWVQQNYNQPVAPHVDANLNLMYTTKKSWRNDANIGWANRTLYARVVYGYFDDDDDNWLKKEPSLLWGHNRRIGHTPFHYGINGEYGRWYQNGIRSNHNRYTFSISRDTIVFNGWQLSLNTSYEVTKESYDDSTVKGFNYNAVLLKNFNDRWAGYAAYRYQKNNTQNSLFNFDNDSFSRKIETGFSYRIDDKNRFAFGAKYNVEGQEWDKLDYYWFHDMHCSQVVLHYEGRDKTWKVKWYFLPL